MLIPLSDFDRHHILPVIVSMSVASESSGEQQAFSDSSLPFIHPSLNTERELSVVGGLMVEFVLCVIGEWATNALKTKETEENKQAEESVHAEQISSYARSPTLSLHFIKW